MCVCVCVYFVRACVRVVQLFRLKDRRGADFCLAPTHEELITQLFANEAVSYRQLPLLLYQIGTVCSRCVSRVCVSTHNA